MRRPVPEGHGRSEVVQEIAAAELLAECLAGQLDSRLSETEREAFQKLRAALERARERSVEEHCGGATPDG